MVKFSKKAQQERRELLASMKAMNFENKHVNNNGECYYFKFKKETCSEIYIKTNFGLKVTIPIYGVSHLRINIFLQRFVRKIIVLYTININNIF